MKKFVLICCFLTYYIFAKAQKVYEFNSTCQQAYQEIIKLKISNGIALLEKAKQQNPNNLIPVYLDNYVDLVTLFFNEDVSEYAIKKTQIEARIKLLETGDASSPFYKYCLSTVYLQKAFIEIKFAETWRASWDVRKSFLLIKENKKAFPTFAPNDLLYGGLQTVIATIPSGYSFIANFIGLSGSISEGMKLVKNFTNSSDPYAKLMSAESAFIFCYLEYHIENKKADAFKFIQTRKLDLVNNHLLAYMAANIAITDKQMEFAKNTILNRNKSAEYYPLPIWDYELGFIKLYHLDFADAAILLESFLAKFKGRFYVKDTYQKLSWCYYLLGNNAAAETARANILKKGATETDADKQALKDAKSNTWPNASLLKARMLFDGGYYSEALAILNPKNVSTFKLEEEKLEYQYRLGRIYDDLHKDAEAIQYYKSAIELGLNRKEYYAARAALQIGEIYEKQNKKSDAIIFYEKCLSIKDHEYKNSLDQKAKAGIERCNGD